MQNFVSMKKEVVKMASLPKVAAILLTFVTTLTALNITEDYDPSRRPNFGGVADVVNIDVNLLAVRGVDEKNAEMIVDVSIQASWNDARLRGLVTRGTLFVNKIPDIWLPNVQIANAAGSTEKSSHYVLEMDNEGLVKLSEKRTARISCPISMAKYPFDRQVCRLQINSYGYSSVHLLLLWHGTISNDIPVYHPEFSFSYVEQTSENIKTPTGAEYSNLYLEIGVTRCPLRVIFRALLPSILLLLFSYYMSFWHCSLIVKHKKSVVANGNGAHYIEATPQQTTIAQSNHVHAHHDTPSPRVFHLVLIAINGMTFLLTVLIAQINFIESPKSSAVSGLDVWLNFVTAIIFVILWHRVQLFFDEFFNSTSSEKQEDAECYANRTTNILKLGIPPVVVVFLVMYFGIYLS